MSQTLDLNDILNKPYKDGCHDCYGLARQYYAKEYGLALRNYARPIGFDHEGLDLLRDNFDKEGFELIKTQSVSSLEKGDGLLFSIAGSKTINHVGVYIGSGYFVHHLYQKMSKCESLDTRWYNRIVAAVRHPDITELNLARITTVSLLDILPPHLRASVQAGLNNN